MGKVKSSAFFYKGSWYHRTKFYRQDNSVGYGKKGGFATKEDAEKDYYRMLDEFNNHSSNNNVRIAKSVSLIEYLRYWFQNAVSINADSATRTLVEYELERIIIPCLQDICLKLTTTEYIDAVLRKIDLCGNSYANKARGILSAAFNYAFYNGLIENNPITQAKKYPRNKTNRNTPSVLEIKELMSVIVNTNWLLEVMLALFCGLRKGEILGLKYSDIDFENQTISIHRQVTGEYSKENGKNVVRSKEKSLNSQNGYRILRVPGIVIDEIEKRSQVQSALKMEAESKYFDQDYICCRKNGEPLSLSAMNSALNRACEKSGVRHVSVYDLRDVYATVMLKQGVSLEKLSALLGHSSIHTTFMHYHNLIDNTNKICEFVNSAYERQECDANA